MLQAKNLSNQIEEIWPDNGPPSNEVQKYIKNILKKKSLLNVEAEYCWIQFFSTILLTI